MCGPRGALTPAHSWTCGRTAIGAHLPRLSPRPTSGQNGSTENGKAPAPLPLLRQVPHLVAASHALPLVAPTHGRASEHACSPYYSLHPPRRVVACPRQLLLVYALLLARTTLRACVCSPCCGPYARPPRGDRLHPRDCLRLMKHLQHEGLAPPQYLLVLCKPGTSSSSRAARPENAVTWGKQSRVEKGKQSREER